MSDKITEHKRQYTYCHHRESIEISSDNENIDNFNKFTKSCNQLNSKNFQNFANVFLSRMDNALSEILIEEEQINEECNENSSNSNEEYSYFILSNDSSCNKSNNSIINECKSISSSSFIYNNKYYPQRYSILNVKKNDVNNK